MLTLEALGHFLRHEALGGSPCGPPLQTSMLIVSHRHIWYQCIGMASLYKNIPIKSIFHIHGYHGNAIYDRNTPKMGDIYCKRHIWPYTPEYYCYIHNLCFNVQQTTFPVIWYSFYDIINIC